MKTKQGKKNNRKNATTMEGRRKSTVTGGKGIWVNMPSARATADDDGVGGEGSDTVEDDRTG